MAENNANPENAYVDLYVAVSRDNINRLNVKRFKTNLTINDLKFRLEMYSGREASNMTITLLDGDKQDKCKLTDDDRTLDSYHVSAGDILLVEGPNYVEFDNNSDERFQLTDEQYEKRKGTLREYFVKNKVGKFNPDYVNKTVAELEVLNEEKHKRMQRDEKSFESINVGERCEVNIPEKTVVRGTVMYKGKIKSHDGLWIGVQYDEPVGKNDGSSDGIKYFQAAQKYGDFVRPSYVTTGDFPEICELDDQEF